MLDGIVMILQFLIEKIISRTGTIKRAACQQEHCADYMLKLLEADGHKVQKLGDGKV